MSNEEIKIVTAEDVYPLRHAILRPGRPFESCFYKEDHDEQTRHYAVYVDDKIASVGSVIRQDLKGYWNIEGWRIRGIATDPAYRRHGHADRIVTAILEYIYELGDNQVVWGHVRENATRFYLKHGFTVQGEKFYSPGVGFHVLMVKLKREIDPIKED